MNESSISDLNDAFAIADVLAFSAGEGGLPFAKISTPLATAEVCLHGAHVTRFQPTGEQAVLWVSSETPYGMGKAIRGGIPVCWPWFADHPSRPELPAHGIARTAMWEVVSAAVPEPGCVRLELTLPASAASAETFSSAFELRLVITVSSVLTVELTATNGSDTAFDVSEALHTYLNVGAIDAVRCEGLDGVRYRDKVDELRQKAQSGEVIFDGRTDRLYEGTTSDILVHDSAFERTIRVSKSGSDTTVVWNPWSELSEKMSDMAADGYRTMVCVEAANASENVIRLQPGESHTLATTIGVE